MKRWFAVLVALAVVAAACGGDDGDASAAPECEVGEVDGDLNFYNWSEYIPFGAAADDAEVEDLIAKFEDQFGVSVTQTFFDSNETMLNQVEAGGAPYDLVVPSDYMVATMIDAELAVPLAKDAIPNLSNLDSKFTGLPFDPDGDYSVPYQWGTTGIGFSYEVVEDAADLTWGLIFDPELSADFAGQISLLNDERETLGAALRYLGYSVNTESEEELAEASALVKDAVDRIATFDSDAFEDLLVSGETVIAHGWNGDFFGAYDEQDLWEDYGYGIPVEGGISWVDNMVIPTTAEHPCTATTFINFIMDAENGATLTNYNFYASPNAAAEDMIFEEILEDPAIYPPPEVLDNLEFIADVGEFATNYADAFTEAKN